jgi:hypothetical protein
VNEIYQGVSVDFRDQPEGFFIPDSCFNATTHCYRTSSDGQSGSSTTGGGACPNGTVAANALSAGTVTIDKNGATAWTVPFDPSSPGYDFFNGSDPTNPPLFDPAADQISVSWSGDTVVAGSGSVYLAQQLALSNPVTTAPNSNPNINANGQDLVLSWTPGRSSDRVFLQAYFAYGDLGDDDIFCQVADSDGTVTIPSSFLQGGRSFSTPQMIITRSTLNTVQVSNATVSIGSQYTEDFSLTP